MAGLGRTGGVGARKCAAAGNTRGLIAWLLVTVGRLLRSEALAGEERKAWRGVFWGCVSLLAAVAPFVLVLGEHCSPLLMLARGVANLTGFGLIMLMPFRLPLAPAAGGQRARLILDGLALPAGSRRCCGT